MDCNHQRAAGGMLIAEYCDVCRFERGRHCQHPDSIRRARSLHGVPITDLLTRSGWCPVPETPKRPNVETSKEK